MVKLIGFAGRMKSGKDTLANHLRNNSQRLLGCIKESVGIVGFADFIRDFTIQYLGINRDIIYNEGYKSHLSDIIWGQMPNYLELVAQWRAKGQQPKIGYMTYREILQTVGEMMCKFSPYCWVRQLEKHINSHDFVAQYLILKDVRKPIEVEKIQALGGKVIYLSRRVNNNGHYSETALDDFPKDKFDAVIDNQRMNLESTIGDLEDVVALLDLKSKI